MRTAEKYITSRGLTLAAADLDRVNKAAEDADLDQPTLATFVELEDLKWRGKDGFAPIFSNVTECSREIHARTD